MSGRALGTGVRGASAPRARVLQPADTIPETTQPIMAINDAARSEREWAQIIRGEFLEIPGMRLTSEEIQRLWGLHRDVCAAVLEDLLHQRFLQLTADGHYVKSGSSGGARQVNARRGTFHGEAAVSAR